MSSEEKSGFAAWKVDKIAVIGAGVVGVPMAALLARAKIRLGSMTPASVVVIQRKSATSGWKVQALNSGTSPIGGVEPELEGIVRKAAAEGGLRASHDYSEVRDADVILICVQTDKKGFGPDYEPLLEALANTAVAIQMRPKGKVPLIIFESTLAPTSMLTLVQDEFARFQLHDGRDFLLGNSPNRVMPGHLVERITDSDKLIGGLRPETLERIRALYGPVVTRGRLLPVNSLTAEVVKTLENAYRDVRIAYSAEIAHYCDDHDINFSQVRRAVNRRLSWTDQASENPAVVPSGGLLIPTLGVGGHCLPKDGILLLWRRIESGADMSSSLILEARRINDESPAEAVSRMEKTFGCLSEKTVALMGTAYRPNSEDTRNSPALAFARELCEKGCRIALHDPHVRPDDPNILRSGLERFFTRDMEEALRSAELVVFCTAHSFYLEMGQLLIRLFPHPEYFFDGCGLFSSSAGSENFFLCAGIGKGRAAPRPAFTDFVCEGFRAVEQGFANEIRSLLDFLNRRYVSDEFNRLDFSDVRRLAGTCITGCRIADPEPVDRLPVYDGFSPRLARCAWAASSGKTFNSEGKKIPGELTKT
ncbi:MAG: nucleotide sugar dehydrogenase [Candidatus Aminicenantales bacterium]